MIWGVYAAYCDSNGDRAPLVTGTVPLWIYHVSTRHKAVAIAAAAEPRPHDCDVCVDGRVRRGREITAGSRVSHPLPVRRLGAEAIVVRVPKTK